MRKIPVTLMALSLTTFVGTTTMARSAEVINGAGATFPYPVYSQWAYKYHQITGVKINYQSIGSGGGIQQIKSKTVDYGASDAPLEARELDEAGLIQFPMIMGGVVPVVNIEGIGAGALRLDSETMANLFLGRIKKWSDPAIRALNPELNLPDRDVTIVHRADGSGTTWIFTHFLTEVSPEWKEKVGAATAVSWPVGVGGKGNEGVSAYVQRINGSLGYVEYAYALQSKLTHVQLKNRAGNYVSPTKESFTAAAANADWENAPGFHVVLVNQHGAESWPITGASFIILHKAQPNKATAQAMLNFFDWCYKHGKDIALGLDYVPMPDNVVSIVEGLWKAQIRCQGETIW